MDQITTINLDETLGLEAGFLIQRFEQAHWTLPGIDAAHRHNFQEILVLEAGFGRQRIDEQIFEVTPPCLALIAKSQVHFFEYARQLDGWLIRFTDDFLPTSLISQAWNYHATLFNRIGPTQSLPVTSNELTLLQPILELLLAEQSAAQFQQATVARHLLAALIIRIERLFQHATSLETEDYERYRVYQQFMTLLERDFAQHHTVHHYAQQLGIAPVRLSKLLTAIVGKGTKQIIDERIMVEAKRYLLYTDLAINEIAFVLGYADQFQFSKAFKRQTGLAPQLFREEKMTSAD